MRVKKMKKVIVGMLVVIVFLGLSFILADYWNDNDLSVYTYELVNKKKGSDLRITLYPNGTYTVGAKDTKMSFGKYEISDDILKMVNDEKGKDIETKEEYMQIAYFKVSENGITYIKEDSSDLKFLEEGSFFRESLKKSTVRSIGWLSK